MATPTPTPAPTPPPTLDVIDEIARDIVSQRDIHIDRGGMGSLEATIVAAAAQLAHALYYGARR